jgi:hypothetical protein
MTLPHSVLSRTGASRYNMGISPRRDGVWRGILRATELFLVHMPFPLWSLNRALGSWLSLKFNFAQRGASAQDQWVDIPISGDDRYFADASLSGVLLGNRQDKTVSMQRETRESCPAIIGSGHLPYTEFIGRWQAMAAWNLKSRHCIVKTFLCEFFLRSIFELDLKMLYIQMTPHVSFMTIWACCPICPICGWRVSDWQIRSEIGEQISGLASFCFFFAKFPYKCQ